MSSFGQRGRDLLLELKSSDWLPLYNDEAVRGCWQEMQLHCDELQDQVVALGTENTKPNQQSRPSLLLHQAAIQRLKRCLLAYHTARVSKLTRLDDLSELVNVRHLLAESEVDFVTEYDKLRSRFSMTTNLDLQSHKTPPEQDLVQVRVLTSVGRLVLWGGGSVLLEKGTLHFLPRLDVESLVRQGFLEQVDGEEAM